METAFAITAHAAAGLVLLAGLGKLHRPTATRDALALTRPSAVGMVRALGLTEVLLAAFVLMRGGVVAFVLLGVAYSGFALVAERQRRRGRGCGCFGSPSTTVSPLHLGVDVTAMLAAVLTAGTGAPGLLEVLPPHPSTAAVTVGLLLVLVVLARLTLTSLPDLLEVRARLDGEVRTVTGGGSSP